MRLTKRIERLEKLQSQAACEHSFINWTFTTTGGGNYVTIRATCYKCDKEVKTTVGGEKIMKAVATLRSAFEGGKK